MKPTQPTQQTKLNKPLKAITLKVILLGVTLLLLLASLVYLTVAWYTKMVSVTGLKFQAAKWEFSANFVISDFSINVYQYDTLNKDLAAPGTEGFIPIDLSAKQSDTDITYMITVDRSTMDPEFQRRIFFYYLDANNNKVYFDGSPTSPAVGTNKQTMEGELSRNAGPERINIYWEWVYTDPINKDAASIAAWDAFDTEVGANPDLYEDYMYAKVSIVGVEAAPALPT